MRIELLRAAALAQAVSIAHGYSIALGGPSLFITPNQKQTRDQSEPARRQAVAKAKRERKANKLKGKK